MQIQKIEKEDPSIGRMNKMYVLQQLTGLQKQLKETRERRIALTGTINGIKQAVEMDAGKIKLAVKMLKRKVEKLPDFQCETVEQTVDKAVGQAEETFVRRGRIFYAPPIAYFVSIVLAIPVGFIGFMANIKDTGEKVFDICGAYFRAGLGGGILIAAAALITAYFIANKIKAIGEAHTISDIINNEHFRTEKKCDND